MAEITVIDPEIEFLRKNLNDGHEYRLRRQGDWDENYELYRDRVQINRLTQRQSVNLPLMKQTVRTLLKDVDDMPVLYFENLDNDKEAEVYKNEYWKWTVDYNHMDLQDIIDKRQVFLFGRTFDQWQIVDGKIKMTVQDPMDIVVSRYCDPFNIHSSRFLIHTHIFVPISTLKNNPDYDQKAVKDLEDWHKTKDGIIKAAENEQMMQEKNQKMSDMGLADVNDPILGETIVELSMHFVYRPEGEKWKDKEGKDQKLANEQIVLYVEADAYRTLMKRPLENIIGVTEDHFWQNHYPYNSWADDVERQDFWSDGIADMIRPINKVLNTWISQLVENRTLRSFGMNYYDATIEGYTPQTFQPVPFGWYPVPGKPQDVFQKVDIPDLSESLDEMKFLIEIGEKTTGATATQQGATEARQITLGEVQLALGEAKERIKGMSKFYTPAWKQRGEMFIKMIEAAPEKLDAVKIFKKGKSTSNIYSKTIEPKDWMSKLGYNVRIWSQDEKNEKDMQSIEKINAVSTLMPGNPKLEEIRQRKLLEFAGLTPDETNEVMAIEEQKRQAMMSMIGQGVEAPGLPPVQTPGGGAPKPAAPPPMMN